MQAAQHLAHHAGESVALPRRHGLYAWHAGPVLGPGLLVQGLHVARELFLVEHHAVQAVAGRHLQVERLFATGQHELQPVRGTPHEAQAAVGLRHGQAHPDATTPGPTALVGGAIGHLLEHLQVVVEQLAHLTAERTR
ncbi:hypothetical protein FQZ97_926070 [compost metagenome]